MSWDYPAGHPAQNPFGLASGNLPSFSAAQRPSYPPQAGYPPVHGYGPPGGMSAPPAYYNQAPPPVPVGQQQQPAYTRTDAKDREDEISVSTSDKEEMFPIGKSAIIQKTIETSAQKTSFIGEYGYGRGSFRSHCRNKQDWILPM